MNTASATSLRLAEPADSAFLAKAALAAGGGIYEHLLARAVGGVDPALALAAAVSSSAGGLSWRNGVIAEDAQGRGLGATIAYEGADFGLPPAIASAASAEARQDLAGLFGTPPAPGAFYLHAIWVDEAGRGRGLGGLLLDAVRELAGDAGYSALSLHVWADNAPALALYRGRGFKTDARIDVPRRPLLPHDGGKLLMSVPL